MFIFVIMVVSGKYLISDLYSVGLNSFMFICFLSLKLVYIGVNIRL